MAKVTEHLCGELCFQGKNVYGCRKERKEDNKTTKNGGGGGWGWDTNTVLTERKMQ